MSSELTREQVEDFASERPKRGEIAPAMWVYRLATALLATWDARNKTGAAMVAAQTKRDIALGKLGRTQDALEAAEKRAEADDMAFVESYEAAEWLAARLYGLTDEFGHTAYEVGRRAYAETAEAAEKTHRINMRAAARDAAT